MVHYNIFNVMVCYFIKPNRRHCDPTIFSKLHCYGAKLHWHGLPMNLYNELILK